MDTIETILLPYSMQHNKNIPCSNKQCDYVQTKQRERDLEYIRSSFAHAESDNDDLVLAPRPTKPLPGYEENKSCVLCKIRSRNDFSNARATDTGCTLSQFLQEVQKQFVNFNGRPVKDLADEVAENLQDFAKNQAEGVKSLLSGITPEEVSLHFKYDHLRQNPVHVKERILRMLVNMLEVGVSSCCEVLENGKTVLSKEQAVLVLNIVDRVQKIASLKEEIK